MINFTIIIFLGIFFIIIISAILCNAISFMRIIYFLITSTRIFCFYIYRWSQMKIVLLNILFTLLETFMTYYRCLFVVFFFSCIHTVVIFSFFSGLAWISIEQLLEQSLEQAILYNAEASFPFVFLSVVQVHGLPVWGITDKSFSWLYIVYAWCPTILILYHFNLYKYFDIFHLLPMCLPTVLKKICLYSVLLKSTRVNKVRF